jgi:hypothetical protein
MPQRESDSSRKCHDYSATLLELPGRACGSSFWNSLSSDAKCNTPAAPPRAGRRIGAAAYDAKAKKMFDLGRQSRKR